MYFKFCHKYPRYSNTGIYLERCSALVAYVSNDLRPRHRLRRHSLATLGAFQRDVFLVLSEILASAEIEALRRVTDRFVDNARNVPANDEVYDLEESHSLDEPRVRRIKTPHLRDPEYARAARHPGIVEVLRDLWGTVRFDTGKLNMKSAGYGAPVEWHQDWAFYPHTNDDLAAVGIMLDDCEMENGPMMVIPGSHQGLSGADIRPSWP